MVISNIPLDLEKYEIYRAKIEILSLKSTALQAKLTAHIHLCELDAQERVAKAREVVESVVTKEYEHVKEVANTYLQKLSKQGANQIMQMSQIHERLLNFASSEI